MTPIYARFVAHVTFLAAVVPHPFRPLLEDFSLWLARLAPRFRPMSRKKLSPGVPYIALAVCENCREKQTVFSPYGGEGDVELYCPSCKRQDMVLL